MNNSSPKSVVLKFGSRLLTNGTAELDTERMATVARAVAACGDQDVVIVSSGAVAAGFRALGHTMPPTRIADRQAAAAVGQGRLMKLWSDAFQEVGLSVGQVLITNDCLTDRKRYVAARRALRALLQAGVVPIVNENDTVSVDEIVVGDNDNLAAMTAALVDADLLALLTDVPGVYDRDPDDDPTARIVTRASSAEELRALCFGKKEIVSTGGMETKLEAAERAGRYGVPTVIAAGNDPSVVDAVLAGESVGTRIEAHAKPLGASLLPRGVVGVGGRFRRGDLVAVVDGQGVEHARGIVRFDDRDVERIRGMHTDEVKIALGMETGTVVMRPDRMVLSREEVTV